MFLYSCSSFADITNRSIVVHPKAASISNIKPPIPSIWGWSKVYARVAAQKITVNMIIIWWYWKSILFYIFYSFPPHSKDERNWDHIPSIAESLNFEVTFFGWRSKESGSNSTLSHGGNAMNIMIVLELWIWIPLRQWRRVFYAGISHAKHKYFSRANLFGEN